MKLLSSCIILAAILLLTPIQTASASAEQISAKASDGASSFEDRVRDDRATFGLSLTLVGIPSREHAMSVVEVVPGGPAARAGIRSGDIVVGIDGPLPAFANDLERVYVLDRRYKAGDKALFEIESQGVRRTIELEAKAMDPSTQKRLLRWIHVANKRIASGESLYCSSSPVIGAWDNLVMAAQEIDNSSLDIGSKKDGHPISAYPAHLPLASDFTVKDIPGNMRKVVFDLLDSAEAVRIHFKKDPKAPGAMHFEFEPISGENAS